MTSNGYKQNEISQELSMGTKIFKRSYCAVLRAFSFKKQCHFNKYRTFSVLIYSYINTIVGIGKTRNCVESQTPEGRSVFTQSRVFPISTRVDITVYQYGKKFYIFFYNIAQRNIKKEIFRVDIELYQHGSQPITVQNLQMLYYKAI